MNNIHYIVRKVVGKEATKQILKQLIELVEVQGVSRTNVLDALSSDFSDFEDGMQHAAAHEIDNLTAIITRNVKDYQAATLPVMAPTDYLAQ